MVSSYYAPSTPTKQNPVKLTIIERKGRACHLLDTGVFLDRILAVRVSVQPSEWLPDLKLLLAPSAAITLNLSVRTLVLNLGEGHT